MGLLDVTSREVAYCFIVKYEVGLIDFDYKICLNNTTPIKSYVPCYSQGVREAIKKELDKMKEANFIEPSISPFAAPMVCV